MKTLIKNGYVIDPDNKIKGNYDILIANKQIIKIKKSINTESQKDQQIIKLNGEIVLPGLIDIHTHLREPGFESKETIKTGCEAAAAGGFTTIACMPNTDPAVDNSATVEYIKSKTDQAVINVLPIGSITKKREGKVLSEIDSLKQAGIKAISDDGNPVMNNNIMRKAMELANSLDLPVISHCEDLNLVGEGVMNEGHYSTKLDLKPIPSVAEDIMIARDILLTEFTGASLHIAHLSTKKGLELIKNARKKGINVTVEVTPHHLILTDEAVKGYDPSTKVNPPLRSSQDRDALIEGLEKGDIDAIATDHAPHTFQDKEGEFDNAANGISGLETALSLIYTNFIQSGVIDWTDLVHYMNINPATIIGIENNGLKEGTTADLIIFDPNREWQVKTDKLKSKGKNTPFTGQKLIGKNIMTIKNGHIVYDDRSDQSEIIYR